MASNALVMTGTAASAATMVADFSAEKWPPEPEAAHGLFRIEVDGLLGFSLIPQNDLARDMASAWLGNDFRTSLCARSKLEVARKFHVDRLVFVKEPGAILSKDGDPFSNGLRLKPEEHDAARAAVDACRASKPQPTKKRSRK